MKRQPNTKILAISEYSNFASYKRSLIHDKRLTNEEKGVLVQILDTKNFYISVRQTAKCFNMGTKHFRLILNNLKLLGYLELNKINGQYIYTFKQESIYVVEFKPYLVDTYTNGQLYALYNSDSTPTKYKNLIKKVFDANMKDLETYNNVINEIKSFEMPKDILKNQLKKEQEEQNEVDIFEYITGVKNND